MFLLFLFVLFIQFFTHWVFLPLTTFVEYFLEIRLLPIVSLLALILLFSGNNIEHN